jgi:hypothetical protein
MTVTPKRPPALKHLSSQAASIALAKHFGDIAKAAKELNINRTDLRKLTWHNPRILNAAHERIELFRLGVRSKIMEAMNSRSAKRRRWGFDAMSDSYEFRDSPFANARWSEPARRERVAKAGRDRFVLEQEAAAELDRERIIERERKAAAERDREEAVEREREVAAVMVARRSPAGRVLERAPAPGLVSDLRPENLKYAGVRGLTRGRR